MSRPEVIATPLLKLNDAVIACTCVVHSFLINFAFNILFGCGFFVKDLFYFTHFECFNIFCRISIVISLNDVVYVYVVVGPRGRGEARRRPLAAARARDAHLTDTVKQGQFRENDLKELNLS